MNAVVVPFPSAIRADHEAEEAAADRVARRARIGARIANCSQVEQRVAGEHAREQLAAGHTEHEAIEAGVSIAKAMKRRRERTDPTPPRAA